MRDKSIFDMIPESIFCPIDGEWYEWKGKSLNSYSKENPYEYETCNGASISLYVNDTAIIVKSSNICEYADRGIWIDDIVNFNEIKYDLETSIIMFSVNAHNQWDGDPDICRDCQLCNINKNWTIDNITSFDNDHYRGVTIFKLEFKITYSDSIIFHKVAQSIQEKQCQKLESPHEEKDQEELKIKSEKVEPRQEPKKSNESILDMIHASMFCPNEEKDQEELKIKSEKVESRQEPKKSNVTPFLLLLLKDKFGEDDDIAKLVLLMLLKDKLDEDDDIVNQVLCVLFEDEFDKDDDMIKILHMYYVFNSRENDEQKKQLLSQMFLKKGDNDDMMNHILRSLMEGGIEVNFNNLLMSYLMFEILRKKGKSS